LCYDAYRKRGPRENVGADCAKGCHQMRPYVDPPGVSAAACASTTAPYRAKGRFAYTVRTNPVRTLGRRLM
jgi:hypothetical protein